MPSRRVFGRGAGKTLRHLTAIIIFVTPLETCSFPMTLLQQFHNLSRGTFHRSDEFVAAARYSTRLLASSDEKKDNNINGQKPPRKATSRRKRERCVDFPSSVYRTKKRKRRKARKGDEHYVPSVDIALENDAPGNNAVSPFEPEFLSILKAAEKSRILNYRAYAKNDAFLKKNIKKPPTLSDLSPPNTKSSERYWAGAPFRFSILISAYFAFPYLTRFLDHFVTMKPDQLEEITSKFGPGISILYATFVSLTLNILYNRQQSIQNQVSTESALIALIQRKVLSIFRTDRDSAIDASQCVADQIRTLVRGSRGKELMGIMYSDPYARILELIEEREFHLMQQNNDLGAQGVVLGSSRDIVKDLVKIRAQRLSDEALALPPTHFFILTVLTFLILLGYTVSILPTVGLDGQPSQESSLLFAVLSAVYVLFFNFASDMNNPFGGVYQIRRSSTASHLLQTKWLITNHPLIRGEVDFDEVEESRDGDVRIRSPGLGDMLMGKEGFYPSDDEDLLEA